jgi:hypothetical protein
LNLNVSREFFLKFSNLIITVKCRLYYVSGLPNKVKKIKIPAPFLGFTSP